MNKYQEKPNFVAEAMNMPGKKSQPHMLQSISNPSLFTGARKMSREEDEYNSRSDEDPFDSSLQFLEQKRRKKREENRLILTKRSNNLNSHEFVGVATGFDDENYTSKDGETAAGTKLGQLTPSIDNKSGVRLTRPTMNVMSAQNDKITLRKSQRQIKNP